MNMILILQFFLSKTPLGVGATGIVNVKGSLKRIEILDPGFDYVTRS